MRSLLVRYAFAMHKPQEKELRQKEFAERRLYDWETYNTDDRRRTTTSGSSTADHQSCSTAAGTVSFGSSTTTEASIDATALLPAGRLDDADGTVPAGSEDHPRGAGPQEAGGRGRRSARVSTSARRAASSSEPEHQHPLLKDSDIRLRHSGAGVDALTEHDQQYLRTTQASIDKQTSGASPTAFYEPDADQVEISNHEQALRPRPVVSIMLRTKNIGLFDAVQYPVQKYRTRTNCIHALQI